MSEVHSFVHINQNNKIPVVNVIMLAYNHAEFIEEAIKSILMQQTKYSYKILIGEDCSTDATREIIMKYYEQYPDKIELCLWKENVGANRNAIELIKLCKGKYIANLEGDDYWTDPFKLEKQISFLEKHKEYIGTAHNVRCVDRKGRFLHQDFGLYSICEEHIYGKEQAERFELASQTASLVYQNIWKSWTSNELEVFFMSPGNGDIKVNILLGMTGDIYFFSDIMANHRRVFWGDSWTAKSYDKNILWYIYTGNCSIQNYMKEYRNIVLDTEDLFKNLIEESFMKLLLKLDKENLNVYFKFMKKSISRRIGL